ncbi:hypothetical protein B0H12DRAFT_1231828 [Mycena haematopus]|nr:hypothetical protein B0H12DRAFT_1231828 [Mycena haematopus]
MTGCCAADVGRVPGPATPGPTILDFDVNEDQTCGAYGVSRACVENAGVESALVGAKGGCGRAATDDRADTPPGVALDAAKCTTLFVVLESCGRREADAFWVARLDARRAPDARDLVASSPSSSSSRAVGAAFWVALVPQTALILPQLFLGKNTRATWASAAARRVYLDLDLHVHILALFHVLAGSSISAPRPSLRLGAPS